MASRNRRHALVAISSAIAVLAIPVGRASAQVDNDVVIALPPTATAGSYLHPEGHCIFHGLTRGISTNLQIGNGYSGVILSVTLPVAEITGQLPAVLVAPTAPPGSYSIYYLCLADDQVFGASESGLTIEILAADPTTTPTTTTLPPVTAPPLPAPPARSTPARVRFTG